MTFVSPWWDAKFADSSIHGECAQKRLMHSALKVCKARRTAVDVGAHIGIWTAFMADQFRQVYSFEPVAENMTCNKTNVTQDNVHFIDTALGDFDGTVSMEKHGDNSGCWHCIDGGSIQLTRLDDYELTDVDLLKIDVEGMEGRVLNGARQTLHAAHPVIVIEYNGLGLRLYGEDWLDPKELLKQHGYRIQARIRKDEIWSA